MLILESERKFLNDRLLLGIHSKNWIRWIPESADNLEFSAERLSENATNMNFAIC